ncbi:MULTISPECIES: hypothetical protein [Streptomyces]|uniref:Uncharacterized protein n=2 Tax=Streptomyces TaxID=1883 RepID=A0A100Y149_9ACTN|nr:MULTISPECIES: hypothetical protein [Streptomyces]KUH35713.1 hypothetical protein ATE80_27650 [Streptomyces kanasensis]UUS32115.1 hypothetical protein NRO40_15670 [Streptomyces changanensis]
MRGTTGTPAARKWWARSAGTAGPAVVCALAVTGAALPQGGGVRVEAAVAAASERAAHVAYTYACPTGAGPVRLAVRLEDRTSGTASAVTRVPESQVCDGARHARTDTVTADGPGAFRAGDSVIVRVEMTSVPQPGDGAPTGADAASDGMTVSTARALILG